MESKWQLLQVAMGDSEDFECEETFAAKVDYKINS
jgi:hypothetical protein